MVLPWSAQQLIERLEQVFQRAGQQAEPQVQSDYAKYLVVRTSGLVEQVTTEIVLAHIASQASPTVLAHLSWRMARFQNPSVENLLQLVGSFDRRWREGLAASITDAEKNALGAIHTQRNKVAHGEDSTVSLGQVRGYFDEICGLLAKVADNF